MASILQTVRRLIQYPNPDRSARPDITLHLGWLAAAIDVDALYVQGTDAARAASSHYSGGGLFWWSTDTKSLWYDDGTSWAQIGDAAGTIKMHASSITPAGHLNCDGASYLRADYPALYNTIGTQYGSADGTHFNVPDITGRVPVGYAAAGGHADVDTLGKNDGVVKANRRPKHNSTVGGAPALGSLVVSGAPAIGSLAVSGAPAAGSLATGAVGFGDNNPGDNGATGGHTQGPGATTGGASGVSQHSHPITGAPAIGSLAVSGAPALGSLVVSGAPTAGSLAVGPGGTAAVDAPAYLVCNFIIKT